VIQMEELAVGGVSHAFYTRRGGVSRGLYTSLNCGFGSGDDPAHVAANRARTLAALDLAPDSLVTCHQHHSAEVAVIDGAEPPVEPPKADALVTSSRGVALGILTADCAPVLFSSPDDGVIGAAHAGWKGALGGVLEATVDAMLELGARADNIAAAIGPCIGQASYEVGPEYPGPFLEKDRTNATFFEPSPREGHFLFDLSGYVARRLSGLGLGAVFRLDCDTCRDSAQFFSYRRSRLRGEPDYGREISIIALSS
jgi:YfiH family protein